MRNEEYYLIVFESQNHAYFLESLLMRKGFESEYLVAPKYLTKSCNASIKIDIDKTVLDFTKEMINEFNLEVYRVYKHYYSDKGKKTYRVVNIRF